VIPKTTGYCSTGKLRYETGYMAQLALDIVHAARVRHAAERVECRIYPCQTCSGWHLTSQVLKTDPKNAPSRKPLVLEVRT
jgi:hypothetical protein